MSNCYNPNDLLQTVNTKNIQITITEAGRNVGPGLKKCFISVINLYYNQSLYNDWPTYCQTRIFDQDLNNDFWRSQRNTSASSYEHQKIPREPDEYLVISWCFLLDITIDHKNNIKNYHQCTIIGIFI
jgi:hypothetical protein